MRYVYLTALLLLATPCLGAEPTERPPFHGPFFEFVDHETVSIRWQSDQPQTSQLELSTEGEPTLRLNDPRATTEHEFIVPHIDRDRRYTIRVGGQGADGQPVQSPEYGFDSLLNYATRPAPLPANPFDDDKQSERYRVWAAEAIERLGVKDGYALVLGAGDGRLAYHLATASNLQVVVVEPDAAKVQQARAALDEARLYGARVSVHHAPLDQLPYGPFFANLIVNQPLDAEPLPISLDALYPLLRPQGGLLLISSWQAAEDGAESDGFQGWTTSADLTAGTSEMVEIGGQSCWQHRRGALPGAGEWTHQYGLPNNAACSQDDLLRGDLTALWWGYPGPRPMPDRGPRNPAPVSSDGRLFVQGNRTLFGLDAYNGTILWFKQIPTMRRANVPRDGSNMVASHDQLYVAMADRCAVFDGQTGEQVAALHVPGVSADGEYDWGYLARVDDLLLGSGVKPGSHYLGDDGEWYEEFREQDTARVVSGFLFALDPATDEPRWRYERGAIINSTLAVADRRVYFIESRHPSVRESDTGRLTSDVQQDQVLVCLDLATGETVWELPYDFSQCQFMTYLATSGQTVVVTGTDRDKAYHTFAFDALSGDDLWQHHSNTQKRHHSGQLDHPTIVGDRLYVNKHTFDLRSGEVLDVTEFDWHGCGVISASQHALFRRYEYHGMLDLHTNQRTEFLGIRSGCWLSLIPSGGVLLAPETSAGCSCGHAIQSSIAYVPLQLVPATLHAPQGQ